MDERMQERIYEIEHQQKLDKLDRQVRKIYEYVVDKEVELSKIYGLNKPYPKTPFEYAAKEFGVTVGKISQIIKEASEALY